MTTLSFTSKTNDHPPISMASYLDFHCDYCEGVFQLVQPTKAFAVGGAILRETYRNKTTGAVAVSRVIPVCLQCSVDIYRYEETKNVTLV